MERASICRSNASAGAVTRRAQFFAAIGEASRSLLEEDGIAAAVTTLLAGLMAAPEVVVAAQLVYEATGADDGNWRIHPEPAHEGSSACWPGSNLGEMMDALSDAGLFSPRQTKAAVVDMSNLSLRCPAAQWPGHSLVLVPIWCGESFWGALGIAARHDPVCWSTAELQALEDAAACLGSARERQERYGALKAQLAQQQALIDAGLTLSESLDLATVLNRLAEQMVRAVGVTSAYLSDWNEETGESTVIAEYYAPQASARERVSDLGVTYNLEEAFGDSLAWLYQGYVDVLRLSDKALSDGERKHMEKYGARSILAVPFIVEHRIVGYAELWESRYERHFTVEEVALCTAMARQGAIAFENARLYEEVRQRANELELVHQVAVATARLIDIDQLMQETTTFISERIYPDVFGFVLRDDATGEFRPHPSYHGLPAYGLEMTVPLEESISGRVVRGAQPIMVADVSQEPDYFAIVEETRSEIAVPLISEGNVIGVINVESHKRNAFSESDLRFLTTLAGQVVMALERARLYQDMENHAGQLAREVESRTVELRAERDRMLAILESAGEGILFTDVEATIQYVNPALEIQTGYARGECLGWTPQLWRSADTEESVFKDMWDTLLSGRRWRGELVNRRKDGSLYDAALTITPLRDAEGSVTGYVGVQADISHLKEVDRLKSKFIANVSHELRTPLTNIRTYVSLMERGDARRRAKYLSVIKQESERLTRLILDILDLSRLDDGSQKKEICAVDVGRLIEEVIVSFKAQAESKQVEMSHDHVHELPLVFAVPLEMQQVLSNLVGNALAYTPSAAQVHVSAGVASRNGQKMVWVRVNDSGPGITARDMPRLFDRFFRGEAARQSNSPGTGLGLAISKEIVEYYGGAIDVESVVGEGATFTVWLPTNKKEAKV